MGRPLWALYFVVNLNPPKNKWASSFYVFKPSPMCPVCFATCCGQMSRIFMSVIWRTHSIIISIFILKNLTNWSAAWNFYSFSNSFYCYVGQIFISTWCEINFIKCCTRWGTGIGTNLKRVGVKLCFSPMFFWSKIAA